ncbi:5'-methylthioadenosine/adenosylhomocysteine nucleosidase [Salinimonas chungwhensis]|uniref:5'-methylthioadenosine/adenosylhomocysteine nucleosidase n=1 Tax=Salinimonas chungwhensis TaxID=265425 RepID=UPI00036CE4C7|nr:5'-methylthioadenosine/adenosylhomocysteine nucleosidase [Salinimonas chungwhensis]
MSKIGILGAMDQEVALLKSSLENLSTQRWHHLTFYEGSLHGQDIVLVKCGIGKVAATMATTALIERFAPDYVVNTGSAGGFDSELRIGDVVIGSALVHHDVDLTFFGYAPGQCAGDMPAVYECDPRLINAAKSATSQLENVAYKTGLICTGDAFIGSDEAADKIRATYTDMKACEMEGAAIAQTCHLLGTPCLVIRSLSDIAGKTSTVSFEEYLDTAAKNSAQLVMGMVAALA